MRARPSFDRNAGFYCTEPARLDSFGRKLASELLISQKPQKPKNMPLFRLSAFVALYFIVKTKLGAGQHHSNSSRSGCPRSERKPLKWIPILCTTQVIMKERTSWCRRRRIYFARWRCSVQFLPSCLDRFQLRTAPHQMPAGLSRRNSQREP